MEYRKKIQELIVGVNDEKVLRFIYELLISFQKNGAFNAALYQGEKIKISGGNEDE